MFPAWEQIWLMDSRRKDYRTKDSCTSSAISKIFLQPRWSSKIKGAKPDKKFTFNSVHCGLLSTFLSDCFFFFLFPKHQLYYSLSASIQTYCLASAGAPTSVSLGGQVSRGIWVLLKRSKFHLSKWWRSPWEAQAAVCVLRLGQGKCFSVCINRCMLWNIKVSQLMTFFRVYLSNGFETTRFTWQKQVSASGRVLMWQGAITLGRYAEIYIRTCCSEHLPDSTSLCLCLVLLRDERLQRVKSP